MTTNTPPRGAPLPPDETTGQPRGPGPDEAAGAPTRQPAAKRPPTRRRTAFERPDEDDRSWRLKGRCTGFDPELWFSPLLARRAEAVSICSICPVRPQCLSWATKTKKQRFGIWGGVDFEVMATSNGVVDEAEALAATVARLPLVDRVAALLVRFPGAQLAEVAERLGYKSAGSLERTLYRRGDEGKRLIRVLKPGSRDRKQATASEVTCPSTEEGSAA